MKLFRMMMGMVVSLCLLTPAAAQAQQTSYTLAVVPQLRISDIYQKWTPFLKKLSQELGVEIKIAPHSSMAQFEDDLAKGLPDFAYMNPLEVTLVKDSQGYIPLVRDKMNLAGILVVKKDGGIKAVQDLDGKEIAFPDPMAFAASLYLQALLKESEKIHFTPNYVKTHSNVYRTVSTGKATAGGGVKKTLAQEPDEVKNLLTIVYETPGTASHPLCAHPRVPPTVRKQVVRAILAFAENPANREMLNSIQMPEPTEADYQRDYHSLKKLKLEKYIAEGHSP